MDKISLAKYKGKPIAALCARYWYRGILSEIDDNWAVLSFARAVEVTGSATQPIPSAEDPIPSDVMVSLGAVEIVCQPLWVWHDMPIKPPEETQKQIAVAWEKRKKHLRELEEKRIAEEKAEKQRAAEDKAPGK
jgi:hypothetical protein